MIVCVIDERKLAGYGEHNKNDGGVREEGVGHLTDETAEKTELLAVYSCRSSRFPTSLNIQYSIHSGSKTPIHFLAWRTRQPYGEVVVWQYNC